MFFDADDFVSNRLAEFTNQSPRHPGWYIESGYVYDCEIARVGKLNNFHRICGTSHIVNYGLHDMPIDIPLDASQAYILDHMDPQYVSLVLGGHISTLDYCAQRGARLATLPFPGALYYVGHGENHNMKWTAQRTELFQADLSVLRTIREEFTLPTALADPAG